jgi:hypothetical protein
LQANKITRGVGDYFIDSALAINIIEPSNIPAQKVYVVTHLEQDNTLGKKQTGTQGMQALPGHMQNSSWDRPANRTHTIT